MVNDRSFMQTTWRDFPFPRYVPRVTSEPHDVTSRLMESEAKGWQLPVIDSMSTLNHCDVMTSLRLRHVRHYVFVVTSWRLSFVKLS